MAGYFVARKRRMVLEVDELVFVPDCRDEQEARRKVLTGEGVPLKGSEKVSGRRGRDRILDAGEAIEA
ncbi:MAG: hypothetical protein ACK40M_08610 [Flavobacteriales bacterium]